MEYIKRDLEEKINSLSCEYSCILVTGPRQVGKTTVLKHLADENREYVTLDDLEERKLAKNDPALFMQMHSLPIFIDEAAVFDSVTLPKYEGQTIYLFASDNDFNVK